MVIVGGFHRRANLRPRRAVLLYPPAGLDAASRVLILLLENGIIVRTRCGPHHEFGRCFFFDIVDVMPVLVRRSGLQVLPHVPGLRRVGSIHCGGNVLEDACAFACLHLPLPVGGTDAFVRVLQQSRKRLLYLGPPVRQGNGPVLFDAGDRYRYFHRQILLAVAEFRLYLVDIPVCKVVDSRVGSCRRHWILVVGRSLEGHHARHTVDLEVAIIEEIVVVGRVVGVGHQLPAIRDLGSVRLQRCQVDHVCAMLLDFTGMRNDVALRPGGPDGEQQCSQ